jgi:hypothetical protein
MIDTGLSRLRQLDYQAKVELPYDPDDVNIRLQTFRVIELISMIDENALDILADDFSDLDVEGYSTVDHPDDDIDIDGDDDLQRNKNLWNNPQKSRFIESLMIKLPIPLFYFDGSRKPWRVIDGLQRLNTIMSFIRGEFVLSDLEYLKNECEGKSFNNLEFPGRLKRRIFDAEIIAYVINPGTPPEVKYNIFKRINTGGLKLNGQEIRNAFFRGGPAELTKQLARSEEFLRATGEKISPKRMIDREYVNRFIAFQIFDYQDYNGKMDLFLSLAMNSLYQASDNDTSLIISLFKTSMERSFAIFEFNSFKRPKGNREFGRQANKALFDTVSWNLVQLNAFQFNILLNNKEEFTEGFYRFLDYELMFKSINDTTGNKNAVRARFSLLQNYITGFLNDR